MRILGRHLSDPFIHGFLLGFTVLVLAGISHPIDGAMTLPGNENGIHSAVFETADSSDITGGVEAVGRALRQVKNIAFSEGERLVFSVEYGPVKAGTATMEVTGIEEINGRKCYHLLSEAKTNDLFSNFFEVRDRVESYMDVEGLFPWRFEKHLREGSYVSDMHVEYDQVNRLAITDKDTMEMPAYVQDILSGFYYGRIHTLREEQSIFIDHHSGRNIYPLEVKVLKRERVKVPAGVFTCIVIEPVLQAVGIFKHSGNVRVWCTDDERKMPVLMKSKMIIGSVAAKLVEYESGDDN